LDSYAAQEHRHPDFESHVTDSDGHWYEAIWSSSWVSTANPTPTALPDQIVTTTAEVPVAEIQNIVTRG